MLEVKKFEPGKKKSVAGFWDTSVDMSQILIVERTFWLAVCLTIVPIFTDDETERKKKKKARSMGEEAGITPGTRLNLALPNVERVKQITITNQPDVSYASKDNNTVETKVVGMS